MHLTYLADTFLPSIFIWRKFTTENNMLFNKLQNLILINWTFGFMLDEILHGTSKKLAICSCRHYANFFKREMQLRQSQSMELRCSWTKMTHVSGWFSREKVCDLSCDWFDNSVRYSKHTYSILGERFTKSSLCTIETSGIIFPTGNLNTTQRTALITFIKLSSFADWGGQSNKPPSDPFSQLPPCHIQALHLL